MIPAEIPAKAGQQNKRPADALLPEIAGHSPVPGRIHPEKVNQIPHAVETDHGNQAKSTERIQKMQSFLHKKLLTASPPAAPQ